MYTALLLLSAQIILTENTPYRVQRLLNLAGNGDGGPASSAIIYQPSGLAEDADGNLYVSEEKSNRIRRITPDGTIETYSAALAPTALLIAPDGGLLYFDNKQCIIRKVNADLSVEDIAGSGLCAASTASAGGMGGSNDRDGNALETTLGNIGAMIYDNEGRLTFTETSLHIIRRLNADGALETIAGLRRSGFSGDNEKAIDAAFSFPSGLAIDPEGNLYVADTGNCRVRRIDVTLYIETWVGSTNCATSSSTLTGARTLAIEQPGSLVFDRNANSLLIALPRAYRVLRYRLEDGRVQPILGSGKLGITPQENPLECPINETGAMLLSRSRGLLVAAPSSFQIFRLSEAKAESFAGIWPQLDPTGIQILDPRGLISARDGSLLLLDSGTHRLLRLDSDGNVATLAGTIYPAGFSKGDNGPALEGTLDSPTRMVERANGDIVIAEATKIRLLTADGTLRTIRTGLTAPAGLAFDSAGRLIFTDPGNHRVMRMDLSTNVATRIAGGNGEGFSGDGAAATSARLNNPGDLAYDLQGNLLIVDRNNRRVRRMGSDGKISTIAGNGLPFSYANITGELVTKTGFGTITALAVDPSGDLFISEEKRLTRLGRDGRIEIITGYESQADDGIVTWINEPLDNVDAVIVLPDGTLAYTIRAAPALKQAVRQ